MLHLMMAATLSFAADESALSRRVAADAHGAVVLKALGAPLPVAENDIDAPMPGPGNLALSEDDTASAVHEAAAFASLLRLASAGTPAITRAFPAVRDELVTKPPDSNGAVGPNHVLSAVNAAIVVHDRDGNVLSAVSLDSFFDSVRRSVSAFDPHAVYDRFAGRWIIVAAAGSRSASSAALLGVSRGGDPTGTWDLYRYDADPTGALWLDYPMLGVNERYIAVSANLYTVADNRYDHSTVLMLDKNDPSASAGRFDLKSGFAMSPAVCYDRGVQLIYFVQKWNSNSNGHGFLRLYAATAAQITSAVFLTLAAPWSPIGSATNDFGPQAGTAQKIDAGDDRMSNAVVRNGVVWSAHTIFLPADAPARAAVQWVRIGIAPLSVQTAIIDDPSGELFYAFPSIAVNRRDEALIGFSRFSAATSPSAAFAFLDGYGGPAWPVVFKEGEAPYVRVGTSGRNRWGDYSATAVDPVNDVDFWTIQEYAGAPITGVDRWATWWARIEPPAPLQRRRPSGR